MELLVNLIAGAIGANVAGGLVKDVNLGLLGNSMTGLLGGGVGGHLLATLGFKGMAIATATPGGLEPAAFLSHVIAAGTCGAAALLLTGLARNLVVR